MKNLLIPVFALMSVSASAETIRFTGQELAASAVFLRPETASLYLDGSKGYFDPPLLIRALGLDRVNFNIDMSDFLDLIDLRFDEVLGMDSKIAFVNGALEVQMKFQDRAGVIRSRVGSVNCRNVRITAILDWKGGLNKPRELHVVRMRFSGSLTGSGVMGTDIVLGRLRSLAMRIFSDQIESMLTRQEVVEGIQKSLTQWARVSTGNRNYDADLTSVKFAIEEGKTSLQFEANVL